MSVSIRNLATAALVLAVFGATVGAHAGVLINETFEGLTAGSSLTGQGSPAWGTFMDNSGQVATGSGANTSTIVATPAASTDNTGNVKSYSNFGLISDDKLALEFLVRAGPNGGDIASVALGNQATGSNPGPFLGIAFGRFELREDNWSITQHPAKTPSNSDFRPVAGTWYQVYSQWDLGAKTANFLIKDVSGTDPNVSDTYFQQLFFDAAQTQATASLGALADVTVWKQARIRLGGNGGVGDIDNLQVSTLKTLADYRFGTSYPPLDRSSSDTEPSSTASDFGNGAGLVSLGSSAWGTPGRSVMANGLEATTESAAIAANEYVTFSITPGTNAPLDLASLQFDMARRFDYVPNEFSLYADEDPGAGGDNFTTLLGTGTIGPHGDNVFHTHSAVLSDTSFLQGITDTTAFRLYLYGNTWTSGVNTDWNVVRLDSIRLFGAVVPEPSTLALLLAAGLALVFTRRRRPAGS